MNLVYSITAQSENRKFPVGYTTAYRFGFNGKENDNETYGAGNEQDYGFRIYNNRLGRFLSVDPITKKYPELTPYQFASNRPIDGIDLDGLEHVTHIFTKAPGKDPVLASTINHTQVGPKGHGVQIVVVSPKGVVGKSFFATNAPPTGAQQAAANQTPFTSIEIKITIGAQIGGGIKRLSSGSVNAGSVTMFGFKAEQQQNDHGPSKISFDYAGKNKQYGFTAGAELTTPLLAGSYQFEQSRGANGGETSPEYKQSLSGMIGLPEVRLPAALGKSGTISETTNSQTGETTTNTSTGADYGFSAAFVIGIDVKFKTGTTSEKIK